jgi:hypothetical protein
MEYQAIQFWRFHSGEGSRAAGVACAVPPLRLRVALQRSKKDDPIEFAFNAVKGEPYRVALVAGNDKAAVVIVSDPIVAKDKGCTLRVERLLPHFELAYFTGSGFPPNSDVSFDGQSYGEKHPVNTKTDSEGNLHFALMPFVTGHHKGSTTIKGVGTTCSPSIKFEWGS